MTTSLKIKILKRPTIKARMMPRFPATITAKNFLKVTRANGVYTFDVDYTQLDPSPFIDPTTTIVAVLDENSGTYKITTLSVLISGTTGIEQHITAPGPVTVLNNAGIVRVDQTVGAPIILNLPAAASKTCPVLIADWRGDAGTNNITIVPNGAEKIQGKAQWTIAGDTGSIFLRPVAGIGYVI